MKKILLITGISLYFGFAGAHADVIYNDTFNRTGALDGSYPTNDNAPGDPAWSETVQASALTTNGSAAVFSEQYGSATDSLPITLTAGTDYYAQVTVDVDAGTSTYWAGVGFTASTFPPASSTFNGNSPVLWAIDRDTGGTFAFSPTDSASSADGSVSGADTFTFLLTPGTVTGTDNYSITDSQDSVDLTGVLSSSDIKRITGFSIGTNTNTASVVTGKFTDLKIGSGPLPTVPESSPKSLFLLGFLGLVALLRLRKNGAES